MSRIAIAKRAQAAALRAQADALDLEAEALVRPAEIASPWLTQPMIDAHPILSTLRDPMRVLRRARRRGELAGYRFDGRLHFKFAEVDTWLATKGKIVVPPPDPDAAPADLRACVSAAARALREEARQ